MCDELRALRLTLQAMPVAEPPENLAERILRQAERRMLSGDQAAWRHPAAAAECDSRPWRCAHVLRDWRVSLGGRSHAGRVSAGDALAAVACRAGRGAGPAGGTGHRMPPEHAPSDSAWPTTMLAEAAVAESADEAANFGMQAETTPRTD